MQLAPKSLILRVAVLCCASAIVVAAQTSDPQPLPPRAAATEYLSHAAAGAVTVAAEFKGHVVPTPQGHLTTEEYVIVEVALFGPADKPLTITPADFTLKVNGKSPLPAQPYGLLAKSLRDPEMEPIAKEKEKSKTSVGGSGQGASDPPPAPAKIPVELVRAWTQRVQKASLPLGERTLPVAGFVYFQYRGKSDGIRSLELSYTGPTGTATLPLEP